MRALRFLLCLPALLLLSACDVVLLSPAGDIAQQQRNLLLFATALMMLIIVPVIAMCLWFAWKYREGNADADHDPDWDHSAKLELGIWSAPLLIIIILGAATWVSTHLLDPYRPISRITADQPLTQENEPLEIQVVALPWKWLFLYPQYDIATVNELYVPRNRPLAFSLTAHTVMNAFFVPSMAGMIYAMPGMETKLHGVMNAEGVYQGLASHYNGPGFSGMQFDMHTVSADAFAAYVDEAGQQEVALDRARYMELSAPSETDEVMLFGSVENGLYDAIVGMCVPDGKMCMDEMMMIDSQGGGGIDSSEARERLRAPADALSDFGYGADDDFAAGAPVTTDDAFGAGTIAPDQLHRGH